MPNREVIKQALEDAILWNESILDSITYVGIDDKLEVCTGSEDCYVDTKERIVRYKKLLRKYA